MSDAGLFKFYMEATKLMKKHNWRYGQAIFNLLCDVRPDVAESIRGTDLDPFYINGEKDDPARWERITVNIKSCWNK